MLPICGRRCATPAGWMVGMPSGRIQTWYPRQPILTIRWGFVAGEARIGGRRERGLRHRP